MTRSAAGRTLALVTATVLHAGSVGAQEVENTSYVATDGSRVLQQSIVVPATLEEVWNAFTTTEGVRSWAVPVADIDFRLGGIWEASYDPSARIGDPSNIRNRFISYLPMRMISMQAVEAPPGFPHPELLPELFTVFEFEPVGPERVRVVSSGVGYAEGEGYDEIYRLFESGNAWSLEQLHRRFVDGPVDWEEALR